MQQYLDSPLTLPVRSGSWATGGSDVPASMCKAPRRPERYTFRPIDDEMPEVHPDPCLAPPPEGATAAWPRVMPWPASDIRTIATPASAPSAANNRMQLITPCRSRMRSAAGNFPELGNFPERNFWKLPPGSRLSHQCTEGEMDALSRRNTATSRSLTPISHSDAQSPSLQAVPCDSRMGTASPGLDIGETPSTASLFAAFTMAPAAREPSPLVMRGDEAHHVHTPVATQPRPSSQTAKRPRLA